MTDRGGAEKRQAHRGSGYRRRRDRKHRGALDPLPDGDGGHAAGGDEQLRLAEADVIENPGITVRDQAERADVLKAARAEPVHPPQFADGLENQMPARRGADAIAGEEAAQSRLPIAWLDQQRSIVRIGCIRLHRAPFRTKLSV